MPICVSVYCTACVGEARHASAGYTAWDKIFAPHMRDRAWGTDGAVGRERLSWYFPRSTQCQRHAELLQGQRAKAMEERYHYFFNRSVVIRPEIHYVDDARERVGRS